MADITTQPAKENVMGVMPVKRLLFTMSVPMMLSMLVQALYNIVDSIFVAQISENALTAVSLAFPIQNLMIAFGGGTSMGVMALLSRKLGARNYEEANGAANNGLFLVVLNSLLFLVGGFFFNELFFKSQTTSSEIIGYGDIYLTIVTTGSFCVFGQMTLERTLQGTGKTFLSMISQLAGAVINIIFDPILIFGWFGFPAMGVAGAALATVLGQFVALCVALYLNLAKNKEIHFSIIGFKPDFSIIRQIYSVGLPAIVMIGITSVLIYGLNLILIVFSTTATAVYGVYFKLQSFNFMPVFGLNNGMIPIVAFNYGARNKERMIEAIKLAIRTAVIIMLAALAVFQLFPETLLLWFNASPEMCAIGVPALRIISTSFVFAGFCVVSMAVFQALNMAFLSLVCSLIRQLIVLLPAAYLLSLSGNIDVVWLAYPIAEIACFLLAGFCLIHCYRTIIKPLNNPLVETAPES